MTDVPEEIRVRVQWAFGGNPTKEPPERIIDPERITFLIKEVFGGRPGSRNAAWEEAQRRFPAASLRKCHTERYWAFYSKPELVEKS